jgi:sugar lactone lactonase YvrE
MLQNSGIRPFVMSSMHSATFSSPSQLLRAFAAAALISFSAFASAQNITTVAGTGLTGSTGDGAAATSATMRGVNGLALDRFGNLYVADSLNHRVRKIALDGIISTVAGSGTQGFSGDGAAATKAALNYPTTLAFAANGDLLIVDYGNHRVRRVAADGAISTLAGTGTAGFAGDGGAASAAQLNNPIGIAVGKDGAIYIGDAHNHRVRKIDGNGAIATMAGSGTQGFAGDGGNALSAQFSFPGAVAVDNANNVYVADYANNRVRKIAADGTISTFAGTGTAGFAGDAAAATAAQLSGPFALAIGTNGSVLIADQTNARIRRVDSAGNIATIAGGASAGDAALATSAALFAPSGIASDAAGQVFIAERSLHRVRKVTSPLKTFSEFRLASGDSYFYTSRDADKALLDKSAALGWSRTGVELLVNAANDTDTKPLIRYYFDKIAQGGTRGSHFYTLLDDEIALLASLNPGNTQTPRLPYNEGTEAYAFVPTVVGANGSCAAGKTPIYRAYRSAALQPDSLTHRFTADLAVYNAWLAAGWSGDGVRWCAAIAP